MKPFIGAAGLALVLHISCGTVNAETARIDTRFSDLKLALGHGYDLILGETRLPACVEVLVRSDTCPDDVCGNLQDVSVSADLVTGYRSMHEILDFDIKYESSASAKIGAFGGSGKSRYKVSTDTDNFTSQDSTQYVVSAQKVFTSIFAEDVRLKPQYQDLVDSGDIGAFVNACGTHFVSAQTRVGHATLLLSAQFVDETSKNVFEAHFMQEAKGSIADLGSAETNIQADLKFSKEIIERSGNVKVEFHGRGGDDSKASLIRSATFVKDFGPLVGAFEQYVQSITGNDLAIGYNYLTSFSTLAPQVANYPKSNEQLEFLTQLTYLRLEISEYLEKIQSNIGVLKGKGLDSSAYANSLQKLAADLRIRDQGLQLLASSCLSNESNCDPSSIHDDLEFDRGFFLGDLLRDAETQPACQYDQNDLLNVVKIGLAGEMPFASSLTDIDISWVGTDGSSGDVPFDRARDLSISGDGLFLMTLDTVRVGDAGEQLTLSKAEEILKNVSDRFYLIKIQSNLIPIPRTYIMRSGVGTVNCPARM